MTTSFTRTRNQIIQRVFGKVTKAGVATVASIDTDTIAEELDLQLKSLHKMGLFWRKVTSVPVTFSLTGGAVSASAGAGDILFPLQVTFADSEGRDSPVYIINSSDYAAIPDKTTEGEPRSVLWKGGSEFMFYPVPATNTTGKLLYEKIADDTSAGAAVDVEVSMIGCLIDIVKYKVADDYGVDETLMPRWAREARQAEIDIRKLGQPRVGLATVAVDDFDGRADRSRPNIGYYESDYIE